MGRRRRRRRSFRGPRLGKRRGRRTPTPKPPKKQLVTTQKSGWSGAGSTGKPVNVPISYADKLTPKEKALLLKEQCMWSGQINGDQGNILVDTAKGSKVGKWYPGTYRITMKEAVGSRRVDSSNFGSALFVLLEEGQAEVNYKPAETNIQALNSDFAIQKFEPVEAPPKLPGEPKMPPPPLPKFNQPDNTARPLGEGKGSWKVLVPKTTKTEWPLFPPNRKFEYNSKHIFRIIPYEKAPEYIWIKRFLGNPDHIEGFGNDIEITTPGPPLGLERGDHVFHAVVDRKDTVWSSYEGVAKYFISRKPQKGFVLLTDLKVNDITDVPLIREDFERNLPGLPKGYVGGKAGEVDLDLYESQEDVAFKERGDSGRAGEVPVSPNVMRWAMPTTYEHPTLFNLEREDYFGAESLGLSGTAGSEDEWAYLMGNADDIKEAKAFKRFRKRHPKRIFRRILRQQDRTIRRIEMRSGKMKPSVRRNIKRNLVKKRMMRRVSAFDLKRGIQWRWHKKRWRPKWKRGSSSTDKFLANIKSRQNTGNQRVKTYHSMTWNQLRALRKKRR